MSAFFQFPLLPTIKETLLEKAFNTPTDIQSKTIPLLLEGKSLIGVAETGSGKTLAYALPILHMVKTLEFEKGILEKKSRPRAAIIVPTRDLGEQVSKALKPFTHNTRVRVRTVLGGIAMDVAKKNASGAFEVLVATPGRLKQLLDSNFLDMSDVRFLVFDEADQMLDKGFLNDATQIVEACAPDCQKALFSATISSNIEELIKKLFAGAEFIRTEGSHRLVPTLTTKNITVINGKRFPLLEKILDTPVEGGTLIFTNTRDQCDKLAKLLKDSGRKCLIYRGEMDKSERRNNLKTFKENKVDLLVATDLGSRGLDVEHVSRVINYHLPQEMENYLHRAGRTARAGRKGMVINLITERDGSLISRLGSIK